VPRNIGNVADPLAGTLSDIHQIAAHFATRYRCTKDLVSGELSLKSWNQGSVYLASQLDFRLDPEITGPFTPNEDDKGNIRGNNGKNRAYAKLNHLVLEFPPALDDSGVKYVCYEGEGCRLQQRPNGN